MTVHCRVKLKASSADMSHAGVTLNQVRAKVFDGKSLAKDVNNFMV